MRTFVANSKNQKDTSPMLYGLFFEDINHALDGGLNANLVQNGFFDFSFFNYSSINVSQVFDNTKFWSCEPQRDVKITDKQPISENKPFSLEINLSEENGNVILKNFGYDQNNNEPFMFLPDNNFECSFFYCSNSDFSMKCFFEYENQERSLVKEISLKKTSTYKKICFPLVGEKGFFAHLVFVFSGVGKMNVTGFRLLPNNHFKSKTNAYKFGKLNAALVESLKGWAKFLRFPGGCLVEGDVSTDFLFEWEKTIGPIETRATKPSVWNYAQTNEIGFFEYLCLCEDLHLEPVPVHHAGLICQIRTEVFRHTGYHAFAPNTKQFTEKVTDSIAHLIYFAKGSLTSKDKQEKAWAEKRKQMGHAKPFNLNFIAIGNENWDKIYFRNFDAALKGLQNHTYCGKNTDLLKKFGIQILSSSGVDINPQDTNPSWKHIKKHYANLIVDEHAYNTPEWFVDNFHRYDFYDKTTSKVFMGEYACHTDADGKGILGGRNTFKSALCEAVFVCGMENNPEIVKMSCYAPLFCKKHSANWDPDLLYFDKGKVFPTCNFEVQKLFATNFGTKSIKLDSDESNENGGLFSFRTNKNSVKKILFDGKKEELQLGLFDTLESTKELENFEVEIEFRALKDKFTLGFGRKKRDGFGFFLHYNFDEKKLLFEKQVNGKRMTLEELASVALPNKISVQYTNSFLKVFAIENGKKKEIAHKNIWKNNTSLFTSLSFDSKNLFLKVVNVGDEVETAKFVLDKTLFGEKTKRIRGKITTLTQNPYDEASSERATQSLDAAFGNFQVAFEPNSINVLVIKR